MSEIRKPEWLRKRRNLSKSVLVTRDDLNNLSLHTVCQSARCPNLAECYGCGVATFLILGDRCTRNCGFCAVDTAAVDTAAGPVPPSQEEISGIISYIRHHQPKFVVITSVTRDDLKDGGASHFTDAVMRINSSINQVGVEVLVPDFSGDSRAVSMILDTPIRVFGHNMETVKRLYATVRRGSDYGRSLKVLRYARSFRGHTVLIKSGIMIGLGETEDELRELFDDLAPLDILTIGQYLRPTKHHLPVSRYYPPEDFVRLAEVAKDHGIQTVEAGPYVRSSYMAEKVYHDAKEHLTE